MQRSRQTRFRSPWQFSSSDLEHHIHMRKAQFFDFVLKMSTTLRTTRRAQDLNIFSMCLLYLRKLTKNTPFSVLATDFALSNHRAASKIFRRVLCNDFKTNTAIPAVIDAQDNINQHEIDLLLQQAYDHMPVFFKELVRDFHDPSGNNRTGVLICSDATYLDVTNSMDLELQKYLYYLPLSGHTVKLITITSMIGKFLSVLPLCSSQSPSSGDAYLMATFLRFQGVNNYLKAILRGNGRFFCILVVDSGYVVVAPNMPQQLQNIPSVVDICRECHCVLLHPSARHYPYHFERNSSNKIVKCPRNDALKTLTENVIRFTRMLRKQCEQSHAGVKQMCQILDCKKLPLTFLQPFSRQQLRKYGIQTFINSPKLAFIVIACLSFYNTYHPGFEISFMDQNESIVAAQMFLRRLFIENPLSYDIWDGIRFTTSRDNDWSEVTVGQLKQNNILGFPQLAPNEINPGRHSYHHNTIVIRN